MGKLRDISFLDFWNIISDAETLFHVFYRVNEHPGSSFIILLFIAEPCGQRKVTEFMGDAVTVGFQNHRQDHGIGKSVRNVIFSTEGMSNCVNISHIGFCESAACKIGSAEHISSCLNIIAVCIGGIQIFKDQLDCIQGVFPCAWCGGISNVGFHCMG